jgi:hypothetical protein
MTAGGPVGLHRAPGAKVVEHRDSTLVVGEGGSMHRFPADSGALVAELMRLLTRTRTRDELVQSLAERFEDVAQNASTIDQAIEHLRQAGAINVAHAHLHPPKTGGRRIVLGVTGAVASAMAPAVAAQLVGQGHTVRVAMTKAAKRSPSHRDRPTCRAQARRHGEHVRLRRCGGVGAHRFRLPV